jgi:outer membrane translocation and assembly module TamA
MIPSGDSQDLPIDLRYFNGGARSVRSFAERELGPEGIEGDPLGGEAYWVTNLQLMRDIAGPLQLIGFFDAGSLSRNHDELGAADLEMAIGLGLRLELPIGPVRLEYGHSLTRDSGEPAGALHFAIGSTF